MTKQEFQHLFDAAIRLALLYAEPLVGRKLPQHVVFRLHGAGFSGAMVEYAQALDALWLDEDHFFRFITLGVQEVRAEKTILFVGRSGHAPTSFEETRNTPAGSGPFNPVVPLFLKMVSRPSKRRRS